MDVGGIVTQDLTDPEVRAPAKRQRLPVWCGIAIAAWSSFLLLVALSWQGVISENGVERESSWLPQWPVAVPALITLIAAVVAVIAFRRGKVRASQYLFVCTLIVGIVGLLSTVLSVAALLAIRADMRRLSR